MLHSLANYSSARSSIGCFRERRETACVRSQRWQTRAIERLGAVTWLRENFKKTLNVDELASLAGMSRSTLHHHFRGLTAMSPLQFQKQLRLHTARQKM